MRVRPSILLSLSLLAGALRPALVVAAELGTAPHFLRLGDRERIVLFSDGPVAGAIADHRADGSIVVTVPEVAAASAIAGREFDDAASGGDGRTKVRITTDAQGAARIEITPADPVGRVHAYATAKPARLTIDLLQKGAPAERSVAKAPVAKVESTASAATKAETAAKAPAKLEVPEAAPAKVDIAASASSKAGPAGGALAQAKHAPGASAKAEPAHVSPAPVPKDVAVGAPVEHATGPAASAAPAATAHVPPRPRDSQQAVASGDAPGPGDRKENADAPGAHVHWDPKLAPAWLGEAHPPSAVPAAGGPGPDAAPADEPDTRDLPVLAIHAAPQQSPLPAPSATPALSVKDGKGRTGKPAATGALANASAPPPVAAAGAPSALAAHDDRLGRRDAAAPATAPARAGLVSANDTGQTTLAPGPAPVPGAPATLICRWRRVAGVPYCAPDPKAGTYAADLGTAEIAGLLDRARSGPTLAPLPSNGPAEAHLNADVALVRAAKSGYLLPPLGEYEHALRAYPAFADANRSRANIALIYHSLAFAPELARLARAKNDPVAPLAAVLLADLLRAGGQGRDVAALLAAGRSAGGITTCLAERVAANVAADESRADAFPAVFAELAKVCPRTILEDSETAWLRARAMVLGGEAARAAETLPALENHVPRRERSLLLVDLVAAQDAAGNAKAARLTEERLAGGTLGRRAARGARLALAARDAAEGRLGDLSGRFADLPMEDALVTRERADVIAVGELLRSGNAIAALGMMTERKVEARSLAVPDQLLLAGALRKVGLLDQARRVLAGIGAGTMERLPDGYYEETGALALARDDAPGALEVAERWRLARGGNAPAGAIALRARARAAKGDARGATETLEKELLPLDPSLARDVAVDLARDLRSADPASALRLAQGALGDSALPPLEPAREAAALAALADAAEATGDRAAAQAAFARLAREFAGEPAAAGAAYRAARLAATAPAQGQGPAQADGAGATRQLATAPAAAPVVDADVLSRRLAAAGQVYAEVVASMGGKP